MKASEAASLVALLESCYPGKEFPASAKATFARRLVEFDYDDGLEGVERVAQTKTYGLPTLADLLEGVRYARRRRVDDAQSYPRITGEGDPVAALVAAAPAGEQSRIKGWLADGRLKARAQRRASGHPCSCHPEGAE